LEECKPKSVRNIKKQNRNKILNKILNKTYKFCKHLVLRTKEARQMKCVP